MGTFIKNTNYPARAATRTANNLLFITIKNVVLNLI